MLTSPINNSMVVLVPIANYRNEYPSMDSNPLPPPAPVALETPKPRKRRRVFMWFFIAVQLLFLAGIVGGVSSANPEDCGSLSAQMCQDATEVGTAIGVAIIIALWVAVDLILGVTYAIYRLARRS